MTRPMHLLGLLFSIATACAFAASNDLHVTAIRQIGNISAPPMEHGVSTDPHFDAFYADMVEALPPQRRAEQALNLAVNRHAGAAQYVIRNAQGWRGKIESGDKLTAMISAAMNSPQMDVRMAGIEMQLAEDGVAKTPQSVEHLIQRLQEDPRGVGAWMLWHLGALGARGIDRGHIFGVLIAYSHSEDETLRRWAVEALSMFGGAEVIDPLLAVAANDHVPSIRESAFCGLAQSATLLLAERYEAIPGLLAITQDLRSDQQNIDWSYQALREITGIHDLPQQPLLWRERLQGMGLLTRR